MSDDHFKIFVEQLREGQEEEIQEEFPPKFLDVHERDLKFSVPVKIAGQAYLADDMLVIHLDIKTMATIPCLICNEPVNIAIEIKGFYHAVPLKEIKGGIYDFSEILRETILLDTPLLAECNDGQCPQRQTLKKYLKEENILGNGTDEEGYKPFAGLEFDAQDK